MADLDRIDNFILLILRNNAEDFKNKVDQNQLAELSDKLNEFWKLILNSNFMFKNILEIIRLYPLFVHQVHPDATFYATTPQYQFMENFFSQ